MVSWYFLHKKHSDLCKHHNGRKDCGNQSYDNLLCSRLAIRKRPNRPSKAKKGSY